MVFKIDIQTNLKFGINLDHSQLKIELGIPVVSPNLQTYQTFATVVVGSHLNFRNLSNYFPSLVIYKKN